MAMTAELERVQTINVATQEAQQHNALIKERYRRLQNAEADQFATNTQEQYRAKDAVRAAVLAPEAPVYTAPVYAETPVMEQTPQITEYVRSRIETPVFTTEKFNGMQQAQAAAIVAPAPVQAMPVDVYMPTQAATVSTEVQFSLSRAAKIAMAAFGATVTVMLSLIGINTHIINQKAVRIQELEQKKQELIEYNEELQRRIEAAQSEETIRQYAESQGMIRGE